MFWRLRLQKVFQRNLRLGGPATARISRRFCGIKYVRPHLNMMQRPPSLKKVCPNCGTHNAESRTYCTRCPTEFWCEWSPELYVHPLTLASLGKSPRLRIFGNAFALVTVVCLVVVAVIREYFSYTGTDIFLSNMLVCWGSYNIWAFTQGRRIRLVAAITPKAVPKETNLRLVSVVLSLILLALGWSKLL